MGKKSHQPARSIKPENVPRHVAIIMDGNGRWARKKFLPRSMGHRAGMKALKETVKACDEFGIKVLTVFAFSTENWKRPREEVDYLMRLLVEYLHKELMELHQQQVCINILGDYQPLPADCRDLIEKALELTRNNSGLIFNVALNYGSRREIERMVRTLGTRLVDGSLELEQIDENTISDALYTRGLPDPDLLIRTAGEMRLSNFLLWQIAYAELWVTDCLWPDFSRDELARAIAAYQERERRFGGLSQ